MITLDEPEKLPHLIRFRLAGDFLKVDELRDFAVAKDMMASTDSIQLETKCLH